MPNPGALEAAHLAWRDLVFQFQDCTRPLSQRSGNVVSLLACAPMGTGDYPDLRPLPGSWDRLEGHLRKLLSVPVGKKIVLAVKSVKHELVACIQEQHGLSFLQELLIREGADNLKRLREVSVEVRLENEQLPSAAKYLEIDFDAQDVGSQALTKQLRVLLLASHGMPFDLYAIRFDHHNHAIPSNCQRRLVRFDHERRTIRFNRHAMPCHAQCTLPQWQVPGLLSALQQWGRRNQSSFSLTSCVRPRQLLRIARTGVSIHWCGDAHSKAAIIPSSGNHKFALWLCLSGTFNFSTATTLTRSSLWHAGCTGEKQTVWSQQTSLIVSLDQSMFFLPSILGPVQRAEAERHRACLHPSGANTLSV